MSPKPNVYIVGDHGSHIAPFEVVTHRYVHDCWVSYLGHVYDISRLILDHYGERCVEPILVNAGKDISHWFNEKTGEIQHFVHPITGASVPYCPHGRILDVGCQVPTTMWEPVVLPWWKDERYYVGKLSKRVRPVKIYNTLIGSEAMINVCCEDTISRIMERYSIYCYNSDHYDVRTCGEMLDLDKTLEENGVPDERDTFSRLGMPLTTYIPMLFMCYRDDMAEEEEEYDRMCCKCPCSCPTSGTRCERCGHKRALDDIFYAY